MTTARKTTLSLVLGASLWAAFPALSTGTALAQESAASGPLTEADIRERIIGNRIYLRVPLGGELPLYYRTDGVVDGSGEAVGLGRFMSPTDQGRWWIDGNRLCQQWETWYDGRTDCFALEARGGAELAWTRQDGRSGTARIAP